MRNAWGSNRELPVGGRPGRALAFLLAACGALALLASPASAELGSPLVRFGEGGSGAGQIEPAGGGGIAADPAGGHVFVSDFVNNRIDEFTAWGEFVKAWGWGVRDGSPEPQTCTAATTCRAGLVGFGPGQLKFPNGIAIGRDGDIFVFEGHAEAPGAPEASQRVQVFSPDGDFLRMFGGGVDHTTGADVCTAADVTAGDECGAGAEGTGPSEFSAVVGASMWGDYIDIGPDGTVYVADQGRVQEFAEDGTYEGEITFAALHATEPAFPQDQLPGMLAVDPVSGDVYLGFTNGRSAVKTISSVWRLRPESGVVVAPAPLLTSDPTVAEPLFAESLATDAQGNLYASVAPVIEGRPSQPRLSELSPEGVALSGCCRSEGESLGALATNVVSAAGGVDLYVLHSNFERRPFVEVLGPPPEKWPPPPAAPTIEAQFAASVEQTSADLGATINPNFWADTRYYLEYGPGACAAGGCPTEVPAPPGQELGSGVVKLGVETAPIGLQGLEPGKTYHYRFVAESSGGGPVYGQDPDGDGPGEATFAAGREGTFTTLRTPSPPAGGCPNEDFRTGPSAGLEDCRAYEMVSPVDKGGGDILTQCNIQCFPARLDQAAPTGGAITYSSYRSFGDARSAGYTTQYLAARGGEGWGTHAISPPLSAPPVEPTGLDSAFQGFSEDLSSGWLLHDYANPLAPGAVAGMPNLYRRDDGSGAYEAITTAPPIGAVREKRFELQGFSANGKRTIFTAQAKLTADAAADPALWQLYESFKGVVRLVSVRPGGGASQVTATAGSASGEPLGLGRSAQVTNAISEEGTRIYWSEVGGEGKLYVRVNGTQTRPVSAGGASFWAATPSGSQAIYTEGGALRAYDLDSGTSTTLAETVVGVLGQSEDLSRVYFVATGPLAGAAEAGRPNLFLHEAGRPLRYVGTLADTDLPKSKDSPSPVAAVPWKHVAHVTPDGGVAVFMSQAPLTGTENTGQNGKPAAEVFRFDAAEDQLRCISCSPTGARADSREWTGRGTFKQESGYWYASKIPTWEFDLHEVRALSADGDRVFFDTVNRLTAADTNGAEDVYSWEAPGTGTCSVGNADYTSSWGGCVSLVSTGTDPRDSEFVDASADGRDAFFLTGQSLLAADPGQIDLYDARVEGGFPPEGSAPPGCQGEGCQQQAVPPGATPNASQGFVGPGDVKPAKPKKCRKGTVRRGGKCVKKNQGKHKKKQKKNAHKHKQKHASSKGGKNR